MIPTQQSSNNPHIIVEKKYTEFFHKRIYPTSESVQSEQQEAPIEKNDINKIKNFIVHLEKEIKETSDRVKNLKENKEIINKKIAEINAPLIV